MKISREFLINGDSQYIEYELTGIELERAYNEYVDRVEKDDIVKYLDDSEYEDLMRIPDDLIQRMAREYHKIVVDRQNQILDEVIEKFGKELEPYKEKWKVFSCEVTQTRTHTYTIRAKNSDDAERMLNDYFDHHEYEVDSDFEDELPDTDFGWFEEEEDFNPDNADITEEEEEW